jgi:hypothetical protein
LERIKITSKFGQKLEAINHFDGLGADWRMPKDGFERNNIGGC